MPFLPIFLGHLLTFIQIVQNGNLQFSLHKLSRSINYMLLLLPLNSFSPWNPVVKRNPLGIWEKKFLCTYIRQFSHFKAILQVYVWASLSVTLKSDSLLTDLKRSIFPVSASIAFVKYFRSTQGSPLQYIGRFFNIQHWLFQYLYSCWQMTLTKSWSKGNPFAPSVWACNRGLFTLPPV